MQSLSARLSGQKVNARDLHEVRKQLHQQVIDRLDLAQAASLSNEQLSSRLKDIIDRSVQSEGLNLRFQNEKIWSRV